METKTVNGVQFYQDWDSEGGIVMVNPKTIKRYHELKSEHPAADKYGVFFAFGEEQFEKGRQSLIRRGYINTGDKVCAGGMGMYGTKPEIERYLSFYAERSKKIQTECDPQEVYFYEWNNHECMISMDDDEALRCVIDTFGKEAAHKIYRIYRGTPTNILAPLNDRDRHLGEFEHTLNMLGRLSFDCRGFFSEGDCRYHRPDCLWAGNINGQIAEMRKRYAQLPDDIKDASCMSKEQIEDYAKRMSEWADDYFSQPEFDPVPATPRQQYDGLEVPLGCHSLWYKDDEGHWQHPNHVWFSADLRRFHWDETATAGRAFTTYLGKKGTTLTRVYIDSYKSFTWEPYTLPHLCDVTAKYDRETLHKQRLYDFRHE